MSKIFASIPPMAFLFLALITLSNYGINWDSAQHFNRGYAYFIFLTQGKINYDTFPRHEKLKGGSDFANLANDPLNGKNLSRSSYFQSDYFNFDYFIHNDSGHPPASDILASLSNYIFHLKLNVLPDIEAFHFYILTVSFLLLLTVSRFSLKHFGLVPSLIATFSIAMYPLFWSESHFNIKDPPVASFMGISILSFYTAVTRKNRASLIVSATTAGLALGTKFNGFFLAPILGSWIILFLLKKHRSQNYHTVLYSIALHMAIAGFIFLVTWPFLWNNPFANFTEILSYYTEIGTSASARLKNYLLFDWNSFPVFWIVITTPLPILSLSIIGIIYSVKNINKKDYLYALVLLWLFIPILRVSLPGTAIYGGVRQIMEYVPALALLSGIGAYCLLNIFRNQKKALYLIFALLYVFTAYENATIHPNENVYFNQLIGGIKGAKEKEIPYWGNSYGNAYQKGVEWLNKNAEKNAKLTLIFGNMVNAPRTRLRSDIDFSNSHFSGPLQNGEYIMEMTHDGVPEKIYAFAYVNNFLEPVHEVKVNGVSILKVWKNDRLHSKIKATRETINPSKYQIKDNKIQISLSEITQIEQVKLHYFEENECNKDTTGIIYISLDENNWHRMTETLNTQYISSKITGRNNETFSYMVPGLEAKYILLELHTDNSCLLNTNKIELTKLKAI